MWLKSFAASNGEASDETCREANFVVEMRADCSHTAAPASTPGQRRRRLPYLLLVAVLLLVAFGATAAFVLLLPSPARQDQAASSRIIVKFKDGADMDHALEGLDGIERVRITSGGRIAIVDMSGTGLAGEGLRLLHGSDLVEVAEEDQRLQLEDWELVSRGPVLEEDDFPPQELTGDGSPSGAAPNDAGYSYQWNLQGLGLEAAAGLPGAWQRSRGSRSIKVCVVDSGVDYTHPDLAANIWTNPGEVPGNGIDDDGNGFVDDVHGYNFVDDNGDPMDSTNHGHGTHVAGIIGAVGGNKIGLTGVAQEVSIIACKFLEEDGGGFISDAIQCMDYCESVGAHITTTSAGSPTQSESFRAAVEAATTDLLLVCSAGNDGVDTNFVGHYPSGFSVQNKMSIAASAPSGLLAKFSNWGTRSIDLVAPGGGIWSTYPGRRYKKMEGTSMAVPHVAGAAALLLSVEPSLSPGVVKGLLNGAVERSPFLETSIQSGGALHAGRAAAALGPVSELFSSAGGFDLSYSSVRFDPAPGGLGAYACRAKGVSALPVDPMGGEDLALSGERQSAEVQLSTPFPIGGRKASAAAVHLDGRITFEDPGSDASRPSLSAMAAVRQVLPMWTGLGTDSRSRVSVKEEAGHTAFTFEEMVFGGGRVTFQAVLGPTGTVTMSWLGISAAADDTRQAIVVGLNSIPRSAPPEGPLPVDLSELRSCPGPAPLIPGVSPRPPPLRLYSSREASDLSTATLCFSFGNNSAGGVSGCAKPVPAESVWVDPVGGLVKPRPLLAASDWVEIPFVKSKAILSIGRNGEAIRSIYVTGRAEILFGGPSAQAAGSDLLLQQLAGPRLSVLASDGWYSHGGILVDHKQLAEGLVVTLSVGTDRGAPLAQVQLSWDGEACVTYARLPSKDALPSELVVGASGFSVDAATSGERPKGFWETDMGRMPACRGKDPSAATLLMPAEVFPPGVEFDLQRRQLRFTPLSSSTMGMCLDPGQLERFPVNPQGGSRVSVDGTSMKQLLLNWESNGERKGWPMLGRTYDRVLVAADGYLAFDSLVSDEAASERALHRTRRVAAMFSTLNLGDSPSVTSRLFPDRLAVTFENLPLRGASVARSSNSFQVVLHSDGRIDIAILAADSIAFAARAVGVSGGAFPPGWRQADLSAAPACVPMLSEAFGRERAFDMEFKTLVLQPRDPAKNDLGQVSTATLADWDVCVQPLAGRRFPAAAGSDRAARFEALSLQDDGSAVVLFRDGMVFPFLGTDYRHVHVGSNGYLTFDQRDSDPFSDLGSHLISKRISLFATDLDPSQPGASVWVWHLPDRVITTFQDVPVKGSGTTASFQVTLLQTGAVSVSYLSCGSNAASAVVGLSGGGAMSPTWQPIDFTDYAGGGGRCT
uniref:Peptidase s8 n=1 Tax=Tetraselmis sp. GSL018 TaxID=582737 RepID=A0A061RE24_9CHLO